MRREEARAGVDSSRVAAGGEEDAGARAGDASLTPREFFWLFLHLYALLQWCVPRARSLPDACMGPRTYRRRRARWPADRRFAPTADGSRARWQGGVHSACFGGAAGGGRGGVRPGAGVDAGGPLSTPSEHSTIGPLESFRTIRTLTEQMPGSSGRSTSSRSSMLSDAEAPRLDLIRRRHRGSLKTSTASIIFYAAHALRWERRRAAAAARGRRAPRAAARWRCVYYKAKVDAAFRQQRVYLARRRSDHRRRKRRQGESAISTRREHKESVIAVLQYVEAGGGAAGGDAKDLQRQAIADCYGKRERAAAAAIAPADVPRGGKRLLGWFLFESFERSHFIIMEVYVRGAGARRERGRARGRAD